MRDPKRIAQVMAILESYWQAYPDKRLGEFLTYAVDPDDLDHISDDHLVERIENTYFEEAERIK